MKHQPLDGTQIADLVAIPADVPFPIDHYYMPVARPDRLIEFDVDRKPCIDPGELFDNDKIYRFIRSLAPAASSPAPSPDEVAKLGLGLGFPGIDAHLYHAAIIAHRPPSVVEIGAGMSTHYARLALEQYGVAAGRLFCFEPFPSDEFAAYCDEHGIPLCRERLEGIDLDRIISLLKPGSILFIDTTHAFRADGELPRILLQLLPKVPDGCLVHFHDIFLPYAVLHREHDGFAYSHVWNESIALAAFLSGRSDFDVVLPVYWMTRERMDEMESALPWLRRELTTGSSFWLRKVARRSWLDRVKVLFRRMRRAG